MDRPRRLTLRRHALAAAVALAVAGATPAGADPAPASGVWDLVLEGSHRQCRLTLGPEPVPGGHALRFPLGCRRALPVLATAQSWALDADRIMIRDQAGRALLTFARDGDGGVFAAEAERDRYRLARQAGPAEAGTSPTAPATVPSRPSAPEPAPASAAATPRPPALTPPPETLPGLYAVDRAAARDVCRLALDAAPAATAGRFALRVLEGCADRGLGAFDPVAWRYDGGRLILTARRGYETSLVAERPELWRREPEAGAPLILRKMP